MVVLVANMIGTVTVAAAASGVVIWQIGLVPAAV
jgi:hypothetical protein